MGFNQFAGVQKTEVASFFGVVLQVDQGEAVQAIHETVAALAGAFGNAFEMTAVGAEKSDQQVAFSELLDTHDNGGRNIGFHF
jgi:hypothetical protein